VNNLLYALDGTKVQLYLAYGQHLIERNLTGGNIKIKLYAEVM
jgi:hypothetical protein